VAFWVIFQTTFSGKLTKREDGFVNMKITFPIKKSKETDGENKEKENCQNKKSVWK
jgi:hypothetical protein